MKKARVIVVEGPDASGKTDVVLALRQRLSHRYDVTCFKEPSVDGGAGKLIRDVFDGKEKMRPEAMMHLFNADAVDQAYYARAALASGSHVVYDRHTRISSAVYQTQWHPLPVVLDNLPISLFRRVDLCILLDAPTEVLAQRIIERHGKQTDKLYTDTDLVSLQKKRDAYQLAPHLHDDLVQQWMTFDTSEPENTPEHIARDACIALDL